MADQMRWAAARGRPPSRLGGCFPLGTSPSPAFPLGHPHLQLSPWDIPISSFPLGTSPSPAFSLGHPHLQLSPWDIPISSFPLGTSSSPAFPLGHPNPQSAGAGGPTAGRANHDATHPLAPVTRSSLRTRSCFPQSDVISALRDEVGLFLLFPLHPKYCKHIGRCDHMRQTVGAVTGAGAGCVPALCFGSCNGVILDGHCQMENLTLPVYVMSPAEDSETSPAPPRALSCPGCTLLSVRGWSDLAKANLGAVS